MSQSEGSMLTKEELLSSAADLLPALRERAPLAEKQRQIPLETIDDLKSSTLLRIGNPTRHGGIGAGYEAMYELAWELGRACGSTAWCYAVWSFHNWAIGHFAEKAQAEYFATGPDTLCSSSYNASAATATLEASGIRLSGRWQFSSGCDAASWAMLGAPTAQGPIWVLVPRDEFEIEDTWFVSGMCATGSKDIMVRDRFVPAHRTLDPFRAGTENLTGWDLHGERLYRIPLFSVAGWDLTAPIIGIAQGAVDEFSARLRSSPNGLDAVARHLRLAESAAEVDAARALQRQEIAGLVDKAERGEGMTALDMARNRRNKAFIAKTCVRAVDRLFEASGGHALFKSQAIQRMQRDVHAAAQHFALSWDTNAETYGRAVIASE
jgi:3-hydroxy-9,10-secoandrosta-1,3,5(10)-triene-9,17-dione monooxygenase